MAKTINPNLVPKIKLADGGEIPVMGMGTFGSDRFTAEEISNAVRGAIRCGYRLFDCAAVYQNEVQIGEIFKEAMDEGVVKREELVITSKVWNNAHTNVIASCKKSLADLQLDYIDFYFIHWPFRNYHAPGCDGDSRNPDSKPFSVEEFMETWKQCEELVDAGLVKYIGMSNMTIPKMEAVLPLCRIKPAAIELELHPAFQQRELLNYYLDKGIIPVGYSPLGSPNRPDRDKSPEDYVDMELPEVVEVAKAHDIHPAMVCLKWGVQIGAVVIPFSTTEAKYISNLQTITEDPLTDAELVLLEGAERNNRLVKGQVFLWEGAKDWHDLWDEDGVIVEGGK